MVEPTLKSLAASDYVPEKYVRTLSQSCVGGQELIRLRKQIHSIFEETNDSLKKNVYENYMQFIDTAKEISSLESEMYQLSHLLAEQKDLLNTLSNTSIIGDDSFINIVENDKNHVDNNVEREEELRRQKLTAVKEKVEGYVSILDSPKITLLYEGFLLELDQNDNAPLRNICAFLFSEGLMLAISNPIKTGKRYKQEAYYELGSLAVVNVRDLGSIKHAFKVLAFPDTRIFQCKSNSGKKEWLDKFDSAKKARLVHDQLKRDSSICTEKPPSRTVSIESSSLNPFDEPDEDIQTHPEWLREAPEELDVFVAQRYFEEALDLLQRAKDYMDKYVPINNQPDHVFADIQRKIEQRNTLLIDVLTKELEVNADKSLQGGLRAARRAVRYLNRLGRASQSCALFLNLCSSLLKAQCKRVKREGAATVYVRNLSSVVFTNLCHMTEEFLRAFPQNPRCTSAYVVWASNELSHFSTHFVKQVFVPQTSLSVLAECVDLVRSQCGRLCNYGIDLCYQLDGALRSPLIKAIRDTKDKLLDAVKMRAADDDWIPMNLKTKSGLSRFLQENNDLGLTLHTYVTGDYWLQLTTNTMQFTKLFLCMLNDCLRLNTRDLMYTIDECLYAIFDEQIKHVEFALRQTTNNEIRQFIIKNADFLLRILLTLAEKKYLEANEYDCKKLGKLRSDYSALLKGISPTTRNISRYSSNEYL